MHRIFTIGHSTRSAAAFVALLRLYRIELLVDVRRYPVSRRHPHFGMERLAASLAESGVAYRHEVDLGGRRAARRDSPNIGIRSASFRGYADHAMSDEFGEALARAMASAARGRTGLMCAEAVPWRCHRQIIADYLVARGVEVTHILDEVRVESHRLSPLAHPTAEGGIVYRAVGGQIALWTAASATK